MSRVFIPIYDAVIEQRNLKKSVVRNLVRCESSIGRFVLRTFALRRGPCEGGFAFGEI